MKRAGAALPFLAVAVASVMVTLYVSELVRSDGDQVEPARRAGALVTNEAYIRSLYDRDLDLTDADDVFRHVFGALGDEITLYPTENYYYFRFPMNGREFWGSLHVPAYSLDSGVLGFGYVEKGFDVNATERIGGNADYSADDGLEIEKRDDFTYAVTFEGRTVVFRFNQLDPEQPDGLTLTSDETFVEPTFDESGLQFYLVFNEAIGRLYWVLDEQGYVPETFTQHSDDLVLGARTGFAFYEDTEANRKILVGVYGPNVMWNNWFDGPFDQLLDNYVSTGQVEIRQYLEAHDPSAAGAIDEYGRYLDDGLRVALAPYTTYFDPADLEAKIEACATEADRAGFYGCLTTEDHDALLDPPFP